MENSEADQFETQIEHAREPAVRETKEPMDKALVARLVVGAAILVLFIVFAVQNTEKVSIEFLSWAFELSQFLMMVLSAVAGVVVWEFAGAYSRRAKKKRS